MSTRQFQYQRVMQFYETDAMGIIHHANYLLVFEEARLQFLRMLAGENFDILQEVNYPLVSCQVEYKNPLRFNEMVTVDYTVEAKGARLCFDYILSTKSFKNPVAFGKTVHVAFDMTKRTPIKLPKEVLEFLQNKD